MDKRKIKLFYIASNGRSGSTLLEMLLNSLSYFWTLGEFHLLPYELKRPVQFCGCGKEVKNCIYWSNVENKCDINISTSQINRFREAHHKGKVLRLKELFNIIFHLKNKKKTRQYGQENYEVLKHCINESQNFKKVRYLIDASKDPYRLYWLAKSGYFDIYCIHITKDPRAFVYSMIKNDTRNIIFKVFRMSFRYVIENSIIKLVAKKTKINYKQIKYEDLASSPHDEIISLYNSFGLDRNIDFSFHEFRCCENHGIAGNQMRHRNDSIFLDVKWIKEMSSMIKNIVWSITSLAAKTNGYKR